MERTTDVAPLSREAWIEASFAVLLELGVDAVRVQPLARSLEVSRGSFYWHFKDRGDLLRALLDRWFESQTKSVIEEVEASGGVAADRLLRLFEMCAKDDGRIELAMRTWARSDAIAMSALQRVDQTRIEYLKALLFGAGHSETVALDLAAIAYLAWIGLYSSYAFRNPEPRLAQMRALHAFLLSNAKTTMVQ